MRYVYILAFLIFSLESNAQFGGATSSNWLLSPLNARLTALGGSLISVKDNDIALASTNPSLLNAQNHHQVSFSHNFTFAGIGYGHLGYGYSLDSITTFSFGAAYASYGEFIGSDVYGNKTNAFSGNEAAIIIGAGRQLNERIRVGVNIKPIFGSLESYNSFSVASDIGLTYKKPNASWAVSFLVKNIGYHFSGYGTEKATLPLDVQIGLSKRLKHLPFRFSILLNNLQKWDVRYDDPTRVTETDIFGNPIKKSSSISTRIDNLFRHFTFGGEFLLGKSENFRIRFGYNHRRRKELTVSSFRSLAGFSGGLGFKIRGIYIDYGIGYYHLVGGTNHLSIRTDLSRFFR